MLPDPKLSVKENWAWPGPSVIPRAMDPARFQLSQPKVQLRSLSSLSGSLRTTEPVSFAISSYPVFADFIGQILFENPFNFADRFWIVLRSMT